MFDDDAHESSEVKKKNEKVIAKLRSQFDTAGLQTVNGFKSGNGTIITFAFPEDFDKVANGRHILFNSKQVAVYHVRQIEMEYAFEIVIGGTAAIDPTTLNNIITWFARFERNGESLLVDNRSPPGEHDYHVISMKDWAATADILTSEFQKDLEMYDLCAPQLLFRLNTTTAWKVNPHTVVPELVTIDANIAAVTNVAQTLVICQEELRRGLFLIQQDNQYTSALGRIDAALMINRQTYSCPIDDDEKQEARTEIVRLTAECKAVQAKLDALHSNHPTIAAPPPVHPSLPLLFPPIPLPLSQFDANLIVPTPDDTQPTNAKHPRVSTANDDREVEKLLISGDDDVAMDKTSH
ncbi:hypothetical protein C8R44DRAFT_867158 [Mycena epipterygia]|nr:hypothetical protein C8R44DRAFT_867158 [Mycena epipterygia]